MTIPEIVHNLEWIKMEGGPEAFEPLSDENVQALNEAI